MLHRQRLLLLTPIGCSCRQHHQEKFGTERHFQKIYVHRSRPKQCAALDLQTGLTMNSAQKHIFHTSSSLKQQDFREQVRDNLEFSRIHGREFPISRLLCRKSRKKCPGRQELINQNSSPGTRVHEKKASVPKPCTRTHQSARISNIKPINQVKGDRAIPVSLPYFSHLCTNAKKNLFNFSLAIT